MPKIVKILLTILAVIAGIFVTLFVVAAIAGLSLPEMMRHITSYLGFIWEERVMS